MTKKSPDKKVAAKGKKKAVVERTINEWLDIFQKLYEKVDSNRTPVEMWIAATAHFSAIGEAIRRMHFANLMYSAAHAFCWMCSFVLACRRSKGTVFGLNESFSDIVTCKYPLVCGHCQETYCHCNPKKMDAEANKAGRYREILDKRKMLGDAPGAYSVSQWLKTFGNIYGQNIHMLTLESIGFHFLEEAGEELTAIRGLLQFKNVLNAKLKGIDTDFLEKLAKWENVLDLYDIYKDHQPEPHKQGPDAAKARLVHAKVDMYIEFADTFSWFCSILDKVMLIAQNCDDENCLFTKDAFQERLSQEYLPEGKASCPSCKNCPCSCVFYN